MDGLDAWTVTKIMKIKKVFIGADHKGFELKEELKVWLAGEGYEVVDCGNKEYEEGDDYPDFGYAVAREVAGGSNSGDWDRTNRKDKANREVFESESRGIVICGSGVGVDIVANKVAKIRCGLCASPEQAEAAREDDAINVLALAADYLTSEQAKDIVRVFLETEFSGEDKYLRRIGKILIVDNL